MNNKKRSIEEIETFKAELKEAKRQIENKKIVDEWVRQLGFRDARDFAKNEGYGSYEEMVETKKNSKRR